MYKIQALLLSIVLFFVGLIYGDKPVEIDYTVKINGVEISAGDTFEWPEGEKSIIVSCHCKNVGRPFEGETFYEPVVGFYKYENGEKEYLDLWGITVDMVSQPELIKRGEIFDISAYFVINPDEKPESGVYSMEVNVYGCEQAYENVLTVK